MLHTSRTAFHGTTRTTTRRGTRRALVATATLAAISLGLPLAGAANAATGSHAHHAPRHHKKIARATRASSTTATVTTSASASATVSTHANATGTNAAGTKVSASGTGKATASATASATATAAGANVLLAQASARTQAYAAAYAKAYTQAYSQAYGRAYAAALSAATTNLQALLGSSSSTGGSTTSGGNTTSGTNDDDCGGSTVLKSDGTTWTCSFDDEFNGTSLDTTKWTPLTTAASGFRNGPECYVDSPDTINVSGGSLNLTARQLATPMTCNDGAHSTFTTDYESGSVDTLGTFSQTYGRFDVRAKFPAATVKGLQSSLWMWPTNEATHGTSSGEIDIAEEYSQYPDRAIPYLHYIPAGTITGALGYNKSGTNVVTNNYCTVNNVNAFHDYVATWTPTYIQIQFDGQTCMTDYYQSNLGGSAPFDVPFFMVLTQALGIGTNAFDPATTPLPATTSIDYVRAWK